MEVRRALLLAILVAAPAAAVIAPPGLRHALHAASVEVGRGCSGALTESADVVVTAAHCIDDDKASVDVRFMTGLMRTARVGAVDRVSDQAVLVLDTPVQVEPLPLARRRQIPGTILYFEGNPTRPRFQEVRLSTIGRCEGLPQLPNALFTTIQGTPGDSGAPLVDVLGRVVGLVHGGVRCHIATPGDTLGKLVDRVLERRMVRERIAPGEEVQDSPPGA